MIKISDFQSDWKHLQDKNLFLACSGGVDSMVLLHLLRTISKRLTVLHVNYQLRGEDSDQDEELVKAFCELYGMPCETRKINTKNLLKQGGNLQDTARKFRHQWFREILAQDENNLIVLGHQLDDQVETFFQHIARKSGVTGMAGMLENHAGIIRPLLKYSKEEIYAFGCEHNIKWREDLSNAGNEYTRNKLRNILLPEVEKEIPELRESVLVLVKAFQETHQMLAANILPQLEKIRQTGNWLLSDYDRCTNEEKAEILRKIGIRQTFIPEIDKIRHSQKGKRLFTDGYEITRESDSIHFGKNGEEIENGELRIEKISSLPGSFDKNTVYLDASKISGQLHLRTWQTGDRMKPIGMKGSKAISDILKDARIPAHEKNKVQLLCDDEKVLWCVGIKISAWAAAGAKCNEILKITVNLKKSRRI